MSVARPSLRWPVWSVLCLVVGAPLLRAQRLEAGIALGAAGGRYLFPRTVTSTTLTGSLVLAADHWRVGVDLPVLRQNGGAVTWIAGLPMPVGTPVAALVAARTGEETIPLGTTRRETHLGDPIVTAATDLVVTDDGSVRLGAEGFAKLPVAAREDGIGTGAADYGIGFNWSAMGNRTFAVADFGYWWIHDLPTLPLDDLTRGTFVAGGSFGEMGRFVAMVRMDATSAITEQVDPRYTLGVGVGVNLARTESLTLAVDRGLSETAPAWQTSLRWRHGVSAGGWGR